MFALLCLKNWGGREGCSKDTQRLQRTFKDPRNHSRISRISFVGFPDYPQGMHFPFHKLLSVEILATLVAPLLICSCDPLLKISQQLKELSCTPPIDKRANLNIIPSTPGRELSSFQVGYIPLICFDWNFNFNKHPSFKNFICAWIPKIYFALEKNKPKKLREKTLKITPKLPFLEHLPLKNK